MSAEKGTYPPVWVTAVTPLTDTDAAQSTASKWRTVLRPDHFPGTLKRRSYTRRQESPTCFPTPERADSIAKGTRIFPSHEAISEGVHSAGSAPSPEGTTA